MCCVTRLSAPLVLLDIFLLPHAVISIYRMWRALKMERRRAAMTGHDGGGGNSSLNCCWSPKHPAKSSSLSYWTDAPQCSSGEKCAGCRLQYYRLIGQPLAQKWGLSIAPLYIARYCVMLITMPHFLHLFFCLFPPAGRRVLHFGHVRDLSAAAFRQWEERDNCAVHTHTRQRYYATQSRDDCNHDVARLWS